MARAESGDWTTRVVKFDLRRQDILARPPMVGCQCGALRIASRPPLLSHLSVRNVVLIERLELDLSPGFNVLTGETGAGKSMLVDALSLVLGGRARPDLVRGGAEEAEVEALFEVPPGSRAAARLEAAGLPCGAELIVRRVVQAISRASERGEGPARQETRSRAYVNGRLCTASQLAELAADLCDIASQHESVSLTDPATHVEYLDAFGKLEKEREHVAEQVEALGDPGPRARRRGRPGARAHRARGLLALAVARDRRGRRA